MTLKALIVANEGQERTSLVELREQRDDVQIVGGGGQAANPISFGEVIVVATVKFQRLDPRSTKSRY